MKAATIATLVLAAMLTACNSKPAAVAPLDPKITALAQDIKQLRENMREPDSFRLVQVVTVTISGRLFLKPADGICVLISGRNGFGGMTREWYTTNGITGKLVTPTFCGQKNDDLIVVTVNDDITDAVKAAL